MTQVKSIFCDNLFLGRGRTKAFFLEEEKNNLISAKSEEIDKPEGFREKKLFKQLPTWENFPKPLSVYRSPKIRVLSPLVFLAVQFSHNGGKKCGFFLFHLIYFLSFFFRVRRDAASSWVSWRRRCASSSSSWRPPTPRPTPPRAASRSSPSCCRP